MKTRYRFTPDILLRTPFYSFDTYDLALLPAVLLSQTFQNAIRLASPALYEVLKKKGFDHSFLKEKERHTLAKYYNRMCYRPTPFGAFAAFTTIHWGPGDRIRLAGDHAALLHLLPDQTVIHRLNTLWQQDEPGQSLMLNPSLYRVGRELRYIHSLPDEKGHYRFSLESIAALPFHTELLDLLRLGPRNAREIREWIIRQSACSSEDAADYLDFLREAQVLFARGQGHLISAGNKPGLYADLRRTLNVTAALPDPVFANPSTATQTDGSPYYAAAERPLGSGALDPGIQSALYGALDVLGRISLPTTPSLLARFITDFSARYDLEKIPLLQALDPDAGIAYGDLAAEGPGDELLDDIRFPGAAAQESQLEWLNVRRLFLKLWTRKGCGIILRDSDLETLNVPPAEPTLPSSLALMFRRTGDHLLIEHAGGPTANNLNGRFSLFSERAQRLCLDVAEAEQRAHPDILFADISLLSDTHTDNISRRRQIYPYEIPINTFSDLDLSAQLPPSDLMVSVRNGQLILESIRLQKRVIPRLASAYNFHKSGLALFRLLCDLQYQGLQAPRNLDLEQLFPGLDHYPRVTYGRSILSPARWRFRAADLQSLKDATPAQLPSALQTFREQHSLPAQVSLGASDQQLVFNLSQPEEAIFFIRCISAATEVLLQEYLMPDHYVTAGGQPLAGQFITYLSHHDPVYFPLRPEHPVIPGIPRHYPMGSEWLYLKIYCTQRLSDQILTGVVEPAAAQLGAALSGWFFVRYQDSGFHLRLRFRIRTGAISALIAGIHSRLETLGLDQLIRSYQGDVYQRELERYGAELMEEVEELFCAGTRLAIASLRSAPSDMRRTSFRLAIHTLSEMTAVFYPAMEERIRFVNAATENFLLEFGASKSLRLSLDQKYRTYQPEIRDWLEVQDWRSGQENSFPELQALTTQLAHLAKQADSLSPERKARLLADLVHMQLNRTFQSRQRQKELLVYFCVQKYLLSAKARKVGNGGK